MSQSAKVADASDRLLAAEVEQFAARQHDLLGDVVQHHSAPMRSGQRSDQNAVESPRGGAAYGSGCVSADSVRAQPLAAEQQLPILARWAVVAGLPRKIARDVIEDATVSGVLAAAIECRDFVGSTQRRSIPLHELRKATAHADSR